MRWDEQLVDNGDKLQVPMPFEDAVKAALEIKPARKPPKKKAVKKSS